MAEPQWRRSHVAAVRELGTHLRHLVCRDRSVPITIKRSRRKTLAIHVFADRPVEVRAPLKCAWRDIDAFLAERQEWIADSLEALSLVELPAPMRYREGDRHFFMGEAFNLRLVAGKTRHVSVAGDCLLVRCREPDNEERVRETIEAFYRREAQRLMPARAETWQTRFRQPLPPFSIKVRKMRARWGHCTADGEICLNTLLMQKSQTAIDFVVAHELCHLRHFAHNASFYRLMDQVMPDWREREKLLVAGAIGGGSLQLDLF